MGRTCGPAPAAGAPEQFDFLIEVRDKLSEVKRAINRLRGARVKIDRVCEDLEGKAEAAGIVELAATVTAKLTAVEEVLIQARSKSRQDPLNYPVKLDDKIAALASSTAGADARPTDQSRELFKELAAMADAEMAHLKTILETDVPDLNGRIKEAGIPHIVIE
jgi:hypothetical protein